ncbi:helix-turn-helix domain-containing protein [Burkholderia sp. Ac-20345]|uniref:Helix-turn-helix domain-containing protein n=1 Tax=Burkholderia contaminans TaxID=488447 RepID=A0A3N8Q6N1_9BURK|nr:MULTISPECIES: helix-turn-helix transcriptional regulator [Burkholderia]MBN3780892.1 helix-turn-helix domain-containing protein [Burkholderia sp. Ac-20345]RQT02709.1 helix-turn-helix domain-containing protein [Burkholderia contaminans]
MRIRTVQEWEIELGNSLRTLRLHRNLDQATLAARAGISVRSLRNLESGNGSSLHTLIEVVRTLGRESWLELIAPIPTINPVMMTRHAIPRQRASKPRRKPPSQAT